MNGTGHVSLFDQFSWVQLEDCKRRVKALVLDHICDFPQGERRQRIVILYVCRRTRLLSTKEVVRANMHVCEKIPSSGSSKAADRHLRITQVHVVDRLLRENQLRPRWQGNLRQILLQEVYIWMPLLVSLHHVRHHINSSVRYLGVSSYKEWHHPGCIAACTVQHGANAESINNSLECSYCQASFRAPKVGACARSRYVTTPHIVLVYNGIRLVLQLRSCLSLFFTSSEQRVHVRLCG
mmetsp:Transcript_48296/g.87112  ORF Transcript_48296/g.87112 Transcript_48296/m.87112 type:complete len:238 (+) Transcript_48296:52-765(+)